MKIETKLVMVEQTVYIASDGHEFDDELDCRWHEARLIGERLQMWNYKLEKTSDSGICRYVKLNSPEQVADFIDLCNFHGISVEGIENPGVYMYMEGTYGYRKTAWIDISKVMAIMSEETRNDQT